MIPRRWDSPQRAAQRDAEQAERRAKYQKGRHIDCGLFIGLDQWVIMVRQCDSIGAADRLKAYAESI